MYNSAFEVAMFNDYFAKVERARITASFPAFLANPGGALWLKRA